MSQCARGAPVKARLLVASAASGRTPSQWTLELIRRELDAVESPAGGTHPTPADPTAKPGRVMLDAEVSALLDEAQARGKFRTRPAALRLVLTSFLNQQTPGTRPVDAEPLKDAVAALMRSNHELVSIGSRLADISRSAVADRTGPGRAQVAQQVQALAAEVRTHVDFAARLTAALRRLLTPHAKA